MLPCDMGDDSLELRLADMLRADADVMHVLTTVRALALPDWRLVSGAIYQTAWNVLTGKPRGHGIKDWDIAYFDGCDLSWEAEDAVIRRVAAAFGDWPRLVEVRNQARVHLWFEGRFGTPYAPLTCTDESFARYASIAHAVGVRLEDDDRLDIVAPFSLDDLFAMRLRPDRALGNGPSHDAKARRFKALWPEVTGELWDGTRLTATLVANRH
jgi:hypothetical protein